MSLRLSTVSRISAACPQYVASPAWMAYDSADGSVWVADPPACVDRIQSSASGPAATFGTAVPVGTDPFGVAYDNTTNEVFVANTRSNNVTVISAKTNLSVGSVGVGIEPMGIAFDPATGEVYVADHGSNNVTVIAGGNLSVVANVAVGSGPVGVAVDLVSRQAFVANYASSNVSVLSDRTHLVSATVATGNGSYGVAVDNRTDTVYVSNNLTGNVSVINASTDRLAATVPIPALQPPLEGLSYDWAADQIWVGGGYSVAIVIDATRQLVVGYAGTDPSGTLYDPTNGAVCVTNTGNATFECLTSAYVSSTQAVTFAASGLGTGSQWGVTVGASAYNAGSTTQWSLGPNITIGGFWNAVGIYAYSIDPPTGYGATPPTGTLCFNSYNSTCDPTRVNVTLTPLRGFYPVSFSEQGLPNGTYWVAAVNGAQRSSTTAADNFSLANGTYNFSVGQTGPYVPNPSSGSFVVNGAGLTIPIQFTAPPNYPVTFGETGLPANTTWDLWLGGATGASSTSQIVLNVTNGTYYFVVSANGYVVTQPPGNLTVHGAPVWENVTFQFAPYTVVFWQTGLPSATWWSVFLGGVGQSGLSTVSFNEPNGTFAFTVTNLTGWDPHPASGNVTVAGQNVNVTVRFSPPNATWGVAVQETGLPAGTSWSIAVGAFSGTSTNSEILLALPDGTYSVQVGGESGYTASAPGSLTVHDQNTTLEVAFAPRLFALTFGATGLPSGTGWGVVIGSQVESGLGPNLTFEEPNGTYAYVVLAVPGFVTHFSGTVVVNGSAVHVPVAFSPQTYPIEFVEFGLPAGSNWSVTVTNASTGFNETLTSSTNAIVFFLPNGTYDVTFGLPSGFTGASSSNLVVVEGRSIAGPSVTATGPPITPPNRSAGPLGIPPWELLAVAAISAILGGLGGAWVVRRRRRAGPGRP